MKFMKRKSIFLYLSGYVIGGAVFTGMNPFGLGYFTAAYLEGAGGGPLLVFMMIGFGAALPMEAAIRYLLTMVSALIILETPAAKNRMSQTTRYGIPIIILLAFSLIEIILSGWKLEIIALLLLEAVIAYISSHIFRKGIEYIDRENKQARIENEQILSLLFWMGIFIYAVPEFGLQMITPLETSVYFIILLSAYKYGVSQATVIGAVSGLALSLRGQPFEQLGLLVIMGIVPSAFREMGRIPTAVIFLVTAGMGGLVFPETVLSVWQIGALASAVLIFLLIPKEWVKRSMNEYRNEKEHILANRNLNRIANTRMKVFADSFMKLSKTLEMTGDKQIHFESQQANGIFEDISERLCKNCDKCSDCWGNNFQDTYESTCQMFAAAEKNGYLDKEDMPVQFLNGCICAERFLEETNKGFEIAKLNHIWSRRMAESRQVIAAQLKEVSSVIENITGEGYGKAQVLQKEEARLESRLKEQGILVKSVEIVENGRRREIYLKAALPRGNCITTKEVAGYIGQALGIRVRIYDACKTVLSKEYEDYMFYEDTKYKILSGVARTMKEQISGDNFSVLKTETGECLLALSDGMGTGKEAGDESDTVLTLLEHLIEAGIKTETAVKLINSSLVLKANQQTFSTLDVARIDLYTGICEFAKMGAAVAFIKRKEQVEIVSAATLPIGMFGNVDFDRSAKQLQEGDIIILLTDGILDSIPEEDKESCMGRWLAEIKSSNPQEIANQILNYALMQTNFVPVDDMTVIAAGLWLK